MPDPFSVKMKLVADINVKDPEKTARVVQTPRTDVKPRVDSKLEVETGAAFEKKSGSADTRTVGNTSAGVNVGAGGGVLGHMLAQKAQQSVPDAMKLSTAELRTLLAPHVGKDVVVTNYDREEASSLADAAKRGDVADTRGTLVGVTDEGVQLKKDGKVNTVNTEFWAIARIRLDDDSRTVLASDPTYTRHFSD